MLWIEEPRKTRRRLLGRYKVIDVVWAVVATVLAGVLWGMIIVLANR